jgi:membrane protein implicated in regulation of membrane protease activity
MAVWVWLLVAGGLFVVETLTANLLFASLAVSAATAMLTAWAGGGFLAQGVAFAVSAILTLAVLRPVALREISKRSPLTATNAEALLGLSATTGSEVTEDSFDINLRGDVWSARSLTGTIPAGHRVTVAAIDGAVAVVEAAKKP